MSQTICKRCVMDTTAKSISFNDDGNCNYCSRLIERVSNGGFLSDQSCKSDIKELIKDIKTNKSIKYDCIVGVSGGVDSTFALYKAKELGLNPLAVHMDNGWNSELANNNIHNIVDKLGVDLHVHVIKWPEYRFLLQSFLEADVLDIELLYDNAMRALNYELAKKYKIKHILSGVNTSTEGIGIPQGWNWFKTDVRNIMHIANLKDKHYKFDTFPNISTYQTWIKNIQGYQWVPFLDYFDYNKEEITEFLIKEFDYKPYPYKHYENIFTRFYQGYILPEKFNVDKRKAHLSSLIITGQLKRSAAINILSSSPYTDINELNKDKRYFLKKMKWTSEQLEMYLLRPEIPHNKYKTEYKLHYLYSVFKKIKSIL